LLIGCQDAPPAISPGHHDRTFTTKVTQHVQLDYLLFVPADYASADRDWPLMLFLHGAGERGDDIERVKLHGPPKLVENDPDFPFIVVSPQCPAGDWWSDETMQLALVDLLDDVSSRYNMDEERVYLTGLSMGGYGAWALAARQPNRFAAVAPICGGGKPEFAKAIGKLPVWAFHGAKDDVVPVEASREMVDALKAAGGEVRFTVYPDADHDSWTQTYENPELYDWLLSHTRSDRR
jgi:predicted peptidase